MGLDEYIVGGRKVLASDLILTLTVPAFEGCGPFVEANRSRISGNSRPALPDRRERGRTEERDLSFTIVLSFSNPPGQSRSHFVIGRDPKCCDVVCTSPAVSNQHIKFAVEGDHVVLYDVSSRGSSLALGDRGGQRTWPRPGTPYKCILPRGCAITLELGDSLVFRVRVPPCSGPELDGFRKRRDAFLANCSDLGALSIASQVPTAVATPSRPAPKKRQHMYWFGKELGRGSFGTVYMVRRLQDWAVFAAKQIIEFNSESHSMSKSNLGPATRQSSGSETDRRGLRREMESLQSLRHERIVGYVDWYEDIPGRWILVMEYYPHGNLQQMIRDQKKPFKKSEIAEILKQTAEGLLYIHGRGVTHRDLKPDNILLRSKNPLALALTDFGLAKRKGGDSYMKTMCGTLAYMAPEMWECENYTNAVDIWALGVVGFALIKNGLPALPKSRYRIYFQFVFDEIQVMFDRDPKDRLVGNVRKMLAQDRHDRLPAAECIEDANELLDSLRSSQTAVPAAAPTPSSIQNQNQDGQSSSRTVRPSEIRELEERYFQTSRFRAAAAAAVDTTLPVRNSTQKRGTDALPRSNSLEAPLPKLPRTKVRNHMEQQGPSAPQRPNNTSATAGQHAPEKKGAGVLPQLRPTNTRRTEQPVLAQKRVAGHQLRPDSPNSAVRNPSLTEKTVHRMPVLVEEKEQPPGQKGHTSAPPTMTRPNNVAGVAAKARGSTGTQNNPTR
ncbi:kinase-like domain-containing protein [Chaetomium fimeti]|uniref:Kinase-like domain-containing protein n=1 Tax=Chaetomium fimeti TaxID=1854472 RepID=A0AAE0HBA5_9PEZI|nr:kinase-like domain-containing protein [Chaetomium fimeti]